LQENNFKAVLESIRDLMNEDAAVPAWLHDILLGYGDPGAAQYEHMEGQLRTVDFKDTFLDAKHLRESFPGHEVEFVGAKGNEELAKPFRITFEPPAAKAEDGGAKVYFLQGLLWLLLQHPQPTRKPPDLPNTILTLPNHQPTTRFITYLIRASARQSPTPMTTPLPLHPVSWSRATPSHGLDLILKISLLKTRSASPQPRSQP
jgi:hypothetical protein